MQLQNQIKMPPKQFCQSQDIIYEYSVSTSVNSDKVYSGTAGGFKKRYHNHMKSFYNKRYISFLVYMETKGETPRKSVFEMVNSQKGPCILQNYKKVSMSPRKTGNC